MRFHFGVKGMNCAACVGHVERAAKKVLGEDDEVTVSLLTNSVCVITHSDTDEKEIKEKLSMALSSAGYGLVKEGEEEESGIFKKPLFKWIISLFFTLIVSYLSMGKMMGLPLPAFLSSEENALWMVLSQLVFCIPVVVINFKFFKNGIHALLHLSPNMDSLIALGSGASLIYGVVSLLFIAFSSNEGLVHSLLHDLYFESAAMILTLVSLGKMLEGNAKERAADAVKALSRLSPKYALVFREGKEISVDVSEIKEGDLVLVRAGEMIPVDGVVEEGNGSCDESALTGESMPVDKERGASVCAASVLLDGFLKVHAEKVGEDTSLSRMVRLLEDAAASKAPISRLADRVSAVFVPIVMGISLLTFCVWMLFTQNVGMALKSAISVLVISCPCALGLATPTAITVGIGRGAKKGILFKSAAALEELSRCKSIVFDKTGTLTEGKPVLTDLCVYENDPYRVLGAAACVERMSSHPLAFAVVKGAELLGIESNEEVENFSSLTGVGAVGTVGGFEWSIVRPDENIRQEKEGEELAEETQEKGILIRVKKGCFDIGRDLEALENEGKTAVVVKCNARVVGIFGIADRIREDAQSAVEVLRGAEVTSLMLTGDNEKTAANVAKRLSIDAYFASLMPSDKERIVKELSKNGKCAMVGDGINDSPALLASSVGIAVGAGTEIAIDCADVVISDSSPMGVCDAFMLSRACIRVIKQNLFWALFYNTVCIPIAAGVFYPAFGLQLSPMLASLAMSFSSVFVVLNALRLRRVRLYKNEKDAVYTLSVDGMMCHKCVEHVKGALEGVDGVTEAKVDLASNTALVRASSSVSPGALINAVKRAGYGAKELKK